MWSNKISKEYSDRKNRFESMFPEAYHFLNKLEYLRHLGFHLGTSRNLHLYYKENFLAYIKIEPPLKFYLSPNYNERLKKEAPKDNSRMFFKPLLAELRERELRPEYDNELIRIRANEEAGDFFECCISALAEIAKVDIEDIKSPVLL